MRHRRTAAAFTAAALAGGVMTTLPMAAAAAAPTDGLVAHYALAGAGGTAVPDASGNGNDAEVLGGAELTPDGLVLDGVDDYVDLPDDLMAGLDAISIALDVRIDPAQAGNYFIYGLGNTGADGAGDGYLFTEGNPYRTAIASGNWSTEQNTQASPAANLTRGVWKHLTYTLADGTAVIYEDGAEVARNTGITITPGSIGDGTTTANYIGRSLYTADPYFRGAVHDFRIYDRALDAGEVAEISAANAAAAVAADAATFTIGDTSAVSGDLVLPATTPGGSAVTWQSSDPGVVTADGAITRPAADAGPASATLTATLTQRGATATTEFTVTVLPQPTDQVRVDAAAAALVVHNVGDVRGDLVLPATGPDGSTVSWASSAPATITATGEVNRPAPGSAAASVDLTATVTIGAATATRVFTATVPALPAPQEYEGYLFSHFLGEGLPQGEQVYFALSQGNDPLRYTMLNDGEPVMTSETGEMGLRDPFIIRSPEGDKFYQIATDLRMYNGSSGSWDEVQRQGSRNIVIWESTDLVTWSEGRLAEVAPPEAGNAWAPEAFYDEAIGEYVVFWASKLYADDDPDHTGDTYNRMMYVTTRDFHTFSEPQVWIDPGYSVIDSTVVEHDGVYYRYTKDERDNTSSTPCSKYITGEKSTDLLSTDYELVADCIGAPTDTAPGIDRGEGPLVFKSNTEERWYMFIDEYGGRGYLPFTTTDLDSGQWSLVPEDDVDFPARFRHGTVLPVTGGEWAALQAAYGEAATDAAAVAADLGDVAIPSVDDVRGNITLPTAGDEGSTLTWTSSAPTVITATGEVTRPAPGAEPVEVTLTVTATRGGASASRTIVATVQPMPVQEEKAAYFFPYFRGETNTNFEEIYFSVSEGNDPLSWQQLNDGESVLQSDVGEEGVRDPFIIRSPEGDRFFLIATDLNMHDLYGGFDFGRAQESGSQNIVVWESTDLVNWSEPRAVEVSSDFAGNTWAPEAFYDSESGQYVVYWASNLYETTDEASRDVATSYNRMMFATTRDFVTFSEPRPWVDVRRGAGRGMIDATVVQDGDTFYRFIKDEASMTVRQERSPELTAVVTGTLPTTTSSPWQLVKERVGVGQPNPWGGTFTQGEGPLAFRDNEDPSHWFMFIDQPSYHGGQGYMAFETDDIASGDWTSIPSADLPSSPRHGTVIPVTQTEYDRLLASYQPDAFVESVAPVSVSTTAGKAPVLPATVTVTMGDGSTNDLPVTWDAVDPASYAGPGQFTVTGTVGAGVSARATATVTVVAAAPQFADVMAGHPFYDEIRWMAERGLSLGTPVGDQRFFYPAVPVSRQAMAAFMYRYSGVEYTPEEGQQTFSDVDPDNPFYEAIEWMHAAEYSNGYADGTFRPTAPVSRQAMAAFLHRLAGSPKADAPEFSDVPADHQFATAIGWLEDTDITEGYPDHTFRATAPVTRQAMAAFLYRFDQFLFRPARAAD
ncbi:immunoglobulin-like domain-containing protein [uncultured Cellulomonas sp.]|uniref:immunoglobulin-like domain-containing protein n=1 Tax=uncultured Cellulomonas sp. TaxID=189682 RepID=UPI00262D078B|nr:immunoglobulin-like domain-containing protein [uncultured Cellulomonas sp.]